MTSVNIVRVKRKLSNNHADALTISYKRKKICDAQPKIEETVKEIFKFIGTSNNHDESVAELVQKAEKKRQFEEDFKTHRQTSPCAKSRSIQKHVSRGRRFKLISEKRGLKTDNEIDGTDLSEEAALQKESGDAGSVKASKAGTSCTSQTPSVNLFDLEQTEDMTTSAQQSSSGLTCNGVPLVAEKGDQDEFVYDLYYLPASQLDFRALERDLEFECARDDELMWQHRSESSDEGGYEDEDDENDEDNWRNDYPDHSGEEYNYCLSDEDEYGEESHRSHHMSHLLHDRLKITDSDDAQSSDSDIENDEMRSRDAYAELWAPSSSYEGYRKRVMRQLYPDHPDCHDEEDDDGDEDG